MKLYVLMDRLAGCTGAIPFTKEEIAKRYFRTVINNNVDMKNNKEDYRLLYVGEMDPETGKIKAVEPKIIMKGEEANEI